MDDIVVIYKERPDLRDPILIEGLPGVGNVGKLAAEHMVDQLKAQKFIEIYSKYFPPQVLVSDSGVVRLVNNEMFYVRLPELPNDLIILVGDYQGLTPDGQYELSDRTLQIAKEFGVSTIYTLGGYGLGKMVETPRVLGAVTHESLVEEMSRFGVTFSKGEPGSGIVGISGLLLGLGAIQGIKSVCLMGETSGYFVDPKGAQAVLEVLAKILKIEIDFTELEDKAKQIDALTSKLRESEAQPEPRREDLGYIG
ncbi:MAG TPA: proteasome assembly chaperone family protein [Thermoplasmata archaeon]|nr:proteasome assembly chaperone family protein [Thermoplasmata archaeon]